MQLYSFSKGRQGLLVLPDGDACNWELRSNKALNSDDVVHASESEEPTDFQRTVERLNRNGYTVFAQFAPGGQRYGFAVLVDENDTDMD